MKVSEVAYLAGTTVRAVRWYHAVDLLPIPEGRPRDYGFDDLARLVRIRWLAESGMSLASIGHLLDGSSKDATEDFDSALERIDAEIQKLAAQRDRIEGLRELAKSDATISPLPASLDSLYTAVRSRLTNPRHIELLERDRVIASIIGAWDKFPDVALYSATEADIDAMVEGLEIFAEAMDADDVGPLVDRFVVVYTKLASKFGLAGLADNIVGISADFDRLLLATRVAYPDRKHRQFMELCLVRLGWVEPEAFEAAPKANASDHEVDWIRILIGLSGLANASDHGAETSAHRANHGAKASARGANAARKATKEENAKTTQDGAAEPAGAARAQEKAGSARAGEKAGAAHTHETKGEIDGGDH